MCYSKKTLTQLTGVLYHYYDKMKNIKCIDSCFLPCCRGLYGRSIVKIPAPEYYDIRIKSPNGSGKSPEREDMKLSEAFGYRRRDMSEQILKINTGNNSAISDMRI